MITKATLYQVYCNICKEQFKTDTTPQGWFTSIELLKSFLDLYGWSESRCPKHRTKNDINSD